jgi:hypothetical protein
MEDIQRHTDCDNFQKPECPHYDNDIMKDVPQIIQATCLIKLTMNYVKNAMNSPLKLDDIF